MTEGTPSWARRCGAATILVALPTVAWRAVLAAGPTLGTPAGWRVREQIPGSGVPYVLGLSAVQLVAALLTVVLIVPGADRVPGTARRWPRGLVTGTALLGAAVLAALCVLSVVHWHDVDPFADRAATTGWTWLCWSCYLCALAWPPLLVATTVGYARARHPVRTDRALAAAR